MSKNHESIAPGHLEIYRWVMRVRVLGVGAIIATALIISNFTDAGRNDAGEVTKSGDVTAREIQVGDCFDDLSEFSAEGTFSSLHAVPCNEGHHWQVFYQKASSLNSYSETLIDYEIETMCNTAAQTLVSNMSSIKYDAFQNVSLTYFYPSYKSWTRGDRSLQCLIGNDTELYFTSVF